MKEEIKEKIRNALDEAKFGFIISKQVNETIVFMAYGDVEIDDYSNMMMTIMNNIIENEQMRDVFTDVLMSFYVGGEENSLNDLITKAKRGAVGNNTHQN